MVVTVENNTRTGGIGSATAQACRDAGVGTPGGQPRSARPRSPVMFLRSRCRTAENTGAPTPETLTDR